MKLSDSQASTRGVLPPSSWPPRSSSPARPGSRAIRVAWTPLGHPDRRLRGPDGRRRGCRTARRCQALVGGAGGCGLVEVLTGGRSGSRRTPRPAAWRRAGPGAVRRRRGRQRRHSRAGQRDQGSSEPAGWASSTVSGSPNARSVTCRRAAGLAAPASAAPAVAAGRTCQAGRLAVVGGRRPAPRRCHARSRSRAHPPSLRTEPSNRRGRPRPDPPGHGAAGADTSGENDEELGLHHPPGDPDRQHAGHARPRAGRQPGAPPAPPAGAATYAGAATTAWPGGLRSSVRPGRRGGGRRRSRQPPADGLDQPEVYADLARRQTLLHRTTPRTSGSGSSSRRCAACGSSARSTASPR